MTDKDISHDVLILIFVVKTLENHKSTGHNWVGLLGQLFKVAEKFVQYVLCPFMTSRNVEIFFSENSSLTIDRRWIGRHSVCMQKSLRMCKERESSILCNEIRIFSCNILFISIRGGTIMDSVSFNKLFSVTKENLWIAIDTSRKE